MHIANNDYNSHPRIPDIVLEDLQPMRTALLDVLILRRQSLRTLPLQDGAQSARTNGLVANEAETKGDINYLVARHNIGDRMVLVYGVL